MGVEIGSENLYQAISLLRLSGSCILGRSPDNHREMGSETLCNGHRFSGQIPEHGIGSVKQGTICNFCCLLDAPVRRLDKITKVASTAGY